MKFKIKDKVDMPAKSHCEQCEMPYSDCVCWVWNAANKQIGNKELSVSLDVDKIKERYCLRCSRCSKDNRYGYCERRDDFLAKAIAEAEDVIVVEEVKG